MPASNFFSYLLLKFRRFCGFICGFVFFISGILKLMDPVGAGLVMDSYLDFLHISFLGFAAKGLGVLFALTETVIGTALITGVWRQVTAVAAMTLQAFFTLLTLILVIFNPTMDCGCFGEAFHLTHLQTLVKNIVLCILLAIAFIPTRNLGRPKKRKFVSFGLVCISVLAFTVYSLLYLPLVDFTDFKPGTALAAARTQIEDDDAYESVFIYEKDGIQKEFTLTGLPDSTWNFVSTQTIQKKDLKGHGATLSFYNKEGDYLDSLATKGNVMVISVYRHDMAKKKWNAAVKFATEARSAGYSPMFLIAGTPEQVSDIHTGEVPVYFCDYKTLITMNRSNAGATWFSQGYLIKEWSRRAYPDTEALAAYIDGNTTEAVLENDAEGSLIFQGFLLYVFAVMLLL
jgi:hypothetical protein